MYSTKRVALLAVLIAVAISTDWAIPIPNVKLVDTIVFAAAFVMGFRIGASVAILAELIWGVLNPLGFGGPIILFTISGELLYAAAGFGLSKAYGGNLRSSLGTENVVLGGLLAICAFFFDLETNVMTALLYAAWPPSLPIVLTYVSAGIPFAISHEFSDFFLGALLAPAVIVLLRKHMLGGQSREPREKATGAVEVTTE